MKSEEKNSKNYDPDWKPKNAGSEFAVKVVKGIENSGSKKNTNKMNTRTADLSTSDFVEGVLRNDRTILARTITLIESNSQKHNEKAQAVLQKLLPKTGNSIRVGVTGIPGAGKSSIIETLGLYLLKQGHKVAVLTIDPSSTVTRGSILGDKTRMEQLSREENCFIRPSPSGGTLGGVARKSRETMLLCEAAGYDVILIETVGVGQSEVTVRSMVDFFLLVMIAGAGDELQGIKKGVIELADALLINKADSGNEARANIAKSDYSNALHYLKPSTEGWITKAHTCSALTGNGIPEIWTMIKKFSEITKNSGVFEKRRKEQSLQWVFGMVEEALLQNFYNNDDIKKSISEIKSKIINAEILPTSAASMLLDSYNKIKS
ncbi:MAG: methylmalonyl Co-A mutase-associated GTPase MeaB [Ignavibacteriae bacterium]|nr:methylmalonyl Co-A mutase-associated GTPase MeaB [Ignavibacteriota bacterium]NOG98009.1 methylmalonyl Co-A mutase-associated GTPase MeaB [Ignavibacteriota bacterium]